MLQKEGQQQERKIEASLRLLKHLKVNMGKIHFITPNFFLKHKVYHSKEQVSYLRNSDIIEQQPPIKYKYQVLVSNKYDDHLIKLKNVTGLYFLYNGKKELLYIGKSVNLYNRIINSGSRTQAYFFKYYRISNIANLIALEVLYILKFKPPLNVQFKHQDNLTVPVPELKEPKMDHVEIFKDINE